MGIRYESVAVCAPLAAIRAAGFQWTLAGLIAITLSMPVAAQLGLAGSELAGVSFPRPSELWIPDATRSQAAALNEASALVDRMCGLTEFHIWEALGGDRDATRAETDTAFAEAGWSLGVINLAADGARTYLATRGTDELVVVWLPLSEAIGLVLCGVAGPRTPDLGAEAVAEPLQQLTPVPRPRPDPNALVRLDVAPLPDAGPAAEGQIGADGAGPVVDPPQAIVAESAPGEVGPALGALEQESADGPAAGSGSVSGWLLAIAVAFAIGAFLLLRWGRISANAIAGANWASNLATVVYSDIASETRKDRRGNDVTRYVPVVAYQYEVDGKAYRAARMRFGDISTSDLAAARYLAGRFPVGAGIEIRYNPKTPGDATIEADPDRLEYRMIAGIALAVLSLAALISALG